MIEEKIVESPDPENKNQNSGNEQRHKRTNDDDSKFRENYSHDFNQKHTQDNDDPDKKHK